MIIGIFCPSDRLEFFIKRLKLTGYRVMEYTAFSLAVLSNLDSLEILIMHAPHPRVVPNDLTHNVQLCVLAFGNKNIIISDNESAAKIPLEKLDEIDLLYGDYKKYEMRFQKTPFYIG